MSDVRPEETEEMYVGRWRSEAVTTPSAVPVVEMVGW